MHCFNVEKLRVTAIMQREITQVCNALWRTRVDIKSSPSHLLLYVIYLRQKIIKLCRCTHLLQAKM